METSADKYVVRPYQVQDHAALVELWHVCFPDDPPWNNSADVIRRKQAQQPEFLLVCVTDGQIVGSVLAGFDGFRGWINKLATHPKHRRKGVASLLLETAELALTEIDCPKINLQVRAENAAVIELYERIGYQIEQLISMGKPVLESRSRR